MQEVMLFIGGRRVSASNGAYCDRINPVSGKIATRASAASASDAVEAANFAASAFPDWSNSSADFRSSILNRAADILLERKNDFVDVMAREISSSKEWALFNCELAASILQDAATETGKVGLKPSSSAQANIESYCVRQPAGVVLGIAPWNAPVVLGVRAVAVPLACGNTVVLKASELCPGTHALIAEILHDAGLPAGALNLIINAPEAGSDIVTALIGHNAIRRINFTGSTRVGRQVAQLCAANLKPCVLELSGKTPFLVLDDANLDAAVSAAAFGAYFNQGQVCISTEKIIVDQKVADEFVEKLVKKVATLKAGDPTEGDFQLGSMISEEAVQRVRGLIDDALSKGASVLWGGEVDHTIMQPALLDGVNSTMRLYFEESFGPIASIIRVGSAEEAISVANDTEYGLAAAVFGEDEMRAMEVARRIESGVCHINAPSIYDDSAMPFGGTKSSGYGRFGGDAGVNEFTELRWISVHKKRQKYPL